MALVTDHDDNTACIHPMPSHATLASLVGTTREPVTRELNALTKSGLLRKDGHTVCITDVRQLTRMVEEGKRA